MTSFTKVSGNTHQKPCIDVNIPAPPTPPFFSIDKLQQKVYSEYMKTKDYCYFCYRQKGSL